MKKVLTIFTVAALSMVSLFAQDMESATALYNEGATALNAGDKETALGYFEEALSQAELIGPEAEDCNRDTEQGCRESQRIRPGGHRC